MFVRQSFNMLEGRLTMHVVADHVLAKDALGLSSDIVDREEFIAFYKGHHQ